MQEAREAGPVLCSACGSPLSPPLYWCSSCRRAEVVTGPRLVRQLEELLRQEREAELQDVYKDVVRG